MSTFTSSIPNLLNGVSTQAAALRLTTQGEEQINGYSTLTNGLIKRPPSHLVKNIGAVANAASAFTHIINRDAVERYLVFITNGDLRVYDLAGNAKTVNFPNGKTYLNNANPRTGFAVTTIADYTFISNKSVVTAMRAAIEPVRPFEGIVTVMAGNYAKRYEILINGAQRSRCTTPDGGNRSHAQYIDTHVIAETLWYGLRNNYSSSGRGSFQSEFAAYGDAGTFETAQASGTGFAASAPWTVTRFGNSIYIANSTTDFTLDSRDGFNNNAMKAVKGTTQRFSNLPEKTATGTVVEISGESSNSFDNYWVSFDGNVWKESRKPGVKLGFDAATMPHILVRESNGSFTFKQATWGDRLVGDEEKSPEPSFIGQTINDVFLHRNRLGFVAGENVILSASGDFFNFWRRTLTTILDTDPIDVGSSFPKVAILRFANSFNGDLLCFAENAQFRLTGGDLLTPKTSAIRLLGEFAVDVSCKPVSSGSLMYWVGKDLDRSVVRELWLDETGTIQTPLEANSHCPDYVPKNVFKLAVSTELNKMCAVSSDTPTRLYVYKYYWSGKDKPQSSWSYWDFGHTVLSMDYIDTDLYIVLLADSDVRIVRVPCQVDAKDTGMDFQILLDQRVTLSGGTYHAPQNRTTYTLPYSVPANIEAWTGYAASGDWQPGHRLAVDSYVGTTLRLVGDTTRETVYAGVPYTFRYRFSPLMVRQSKETGTTVVTEGRTQVLRMRLNFSDTAYFTVDVTPENRAKFTYDSAVNAWALDDPAFKIEELVLEEGDYSFPIKCENTRVSIDLINDQAVPSGFISADWVGLWQQKTRRI